MSEERILDFVASRPPRRSHDFGAHDFKLSGKPQLTYVRPLLFVVGGKDVALVIACLRINQLVRDNAFQRIGQVVVNTVRRIVLVHHFKRFGRAVGNLPRQRVDEQIAVACAPWIFQRFRRTVVDGDKIHLERLRPQLTGHEVDVVAEFRCTVARIRVGSSEGDVVRHMDLRVVTRRNARLNPRPHVVIARDFFRVLHRQVNTGVVTIVRDADDVRSIAVQADSVNVICHSSFPSVLTAGCSG